jgi:hypothetical protein
MGPQMTQMGPQMTQMGPQMTQMGPQMTQMGPQMTQMAQMQPQMTQMELQVQVARYLPPSSDFRPVRQLVQRRPARPGAATGPEPVAHRLQR